MFSKKPAIAPARERGFSLLEVLITSAIIGIITAIVVIKYGAFNSSVLLKNQAYEVGLAVREAQVFSVSVRGSGSQFRDAYGIHLDVSGGPTQELILFFDTHPSPAGNLQYDEGSDQVIERLIIDSRFEIYELCIGDPGSLNCGVRDLSISFTRPDFDAQLYSTDFIGAGSLAEIRMRGASESSIIRTVAVSSTGQISIQ